MIECATLYTCEVDDKDVAFEEIICQLKKITLKKHSVGILTCHTEFVDSGVLSYVAENIPFDVIGITTSTQAVTGLVLEMALSIFVITSDEARFVIGVISGITDNMRNCLLDTVDANAIPNGEKHNPSLVFAFSGMFDNCSGDAFLTSLTKIFPSTPIFGGFPASDALDFAGSVVCLNGQISTSMNAFILCYGNINPRFVIATIPENKKLPYNGTITKSTENVVYEIDGRNALEYMSDIGFLDTTGLVIPVAKFIPFLLNQSVRDDYDGVPVLRLISKIIPNEAVFFAGNMDAGSTFSTISIRGYLQCAEKELNKIANMQNVNGVLVLSCITRQMLLYSSNPLAELELANSILGNTPFMMGFVAGEYCPTSQRNGVYTNRFHNFSLIAVVF